MSTKLSILATSLLLSTMTPSAATDSSAPAGFRMEVLVHNGSSVPASIPIECLHGCAWDKQIIDCPATTKECRVIIDGRFGIEPWTKEAAGPPPVLAWTGTVCLGLVAPNAPSTAEADTSEQDRSSVARVIVRRVDAGSPAEVAGFKEGDLFAGFNGVTVKRAEDLHDIVQHKLAGEPFQATLNRNGTEIQVNGHLGIFTTAGCRPADPQLLAMPAAETLPMAPFSISIPDLRVPIELRCLEGCDLWRPTPVSPCPSPQSCSFEYTLRGLSFTRRAIR
jgi:hypothetical protein